MKSQAKYFSSSAATLLAMLGMAVGTGNIWRFPRIIGEYGGAAFLIPYFVFLFTWAFPLLLIEFGLGRQFRKGPARAFAALSKRKTVLGLFVAFCTIAIMGYYAVVAGWCLRYLAAATTSPLYADPHNYWSTFIHQQTEVGLFHLLVLAAGLVVVTKGVGYIERANKIFVPALFVLLFVSAIRAVLLPNAAIGFDFLFRPDAAKLLDANTWFQALAQIAWSTGAGMGLFLTYSVYARSEEDITSITAATCIGDAAASLLAASAIVPTVFTILGATKAPEALGGGNTNLVFIWLPQLFEQIPLGHFFLTLFFLSLFFAAFTSLIAGLELALRTVQDFGKTRKQALAIVSVLMVSLGLPSALSLGFLENQDWVWSIGLIFSGFFFALLVGEYGIDAFSRDFLNLPNARFRIGPWWGKLIRYGIPAQFFFLIAWWLWQAVVSHPDTWWNALETRSLATCLLQLALLFGVAILLRGRLNRCPHLA